MSDLQDAAESFDPLGEWVEKEYPVVDTAVRYVHPDEHYIQVTKKAGGGYTVSYRVGDSRPLRTFDTPANAFGAVREVMAVREVTLDDDPGGGLLVLEEVKGRLDDLRDEYQQAAKESGSDTQARDLKNQATGIGTAMREVGRMIDERESDDAEQE